jgi:hypothetical protein
MTGPTGNTCRRCHKRIVRPEEDALILTKALQIRQGVLYLQCQCGTWNAAPSRLCDRLRLILILTA